jgi:Kef-type K+ transport system membrane component KefB
MKRQLKFYAITILPMLVLIGLFIWQGKTLSPSAFISGVKDANAGGASVAESFKHPLTILLMQILVVLGAAKVIGYLFTRIGQQSVIGETAAGIMLGPSLLGLLFPGAYHFLFPSSSLPNLQLISQIGLVLFMFIIGMELDLDKLKSRVGEAIVISHLSIAFPFLLGVALAYFLYSNYAPANIPFVAYSLFMGIAMSITAFPVLARILKERNMTKTPVGSMAIICAAIDDVTAWCILAVIIAIARAGNVSNALLTIALTVVFVFFMFTVAKPILKKLSEKFFQNDTLQAPFIATIFLTLIFSAFVAEIIGIHALFGAFLAGVIMPPNFSLRKLFTERVEDVSVMLLLPLFFAFTGLRTQIGLLNGSNLWLVCALIIGLAIIGKFVGGSVAAKVVGLSWKDALSIGALMNTRGLMELIVLNIGYDLGILRPEVFTMFVLMALVTTFLTAPALSLIETLFSKNGSSEISKHNKAVQ